MYKSFFFLTLLPIFLLTSCSNEELTDMDELFFPKAPVSLVKKINNRQNSTNESKMTGPCDNAVSISIVRETDFEFKRPKFDCDRGFWFCSESHTYRVCKDSDGTILDKQEIFANKSSTKTSKYTVDIFELDNNEIILSFPKQYFIGGNYTNKDLKFFSVDEEMEILPNILLIMGDYDVYEHNNNLVVLISTKQKQ